jgi:hypothetical protein
MSALMLASTLATAQGDAFSLQWTAPAACPSATQVGTRIESLLSSLPSRSTLLLVRARIDAIPEGFELHLSLEQNGHISNRRLTSAKCDELGEATALAVSLALHPVGTPRVAAPAESPPPPSQPSSELWLAGLGDFDIGPLPAPQGRIRLELAYRQGPVRVHVDASTGFSQVVLGVPRTDAGATVHVPLAGGVAACGVPIHHTWEVDLCLGLQAGLFTATGREIAQPKTNAGLWLAPVAQVGAEFGFTSRLAVRAQLTAGASLSRPQVTIDSTSLFQSAWFYGRASLGLSVRLF